jgi:hypothetical protein
MKKIIRNVDKEKGIVQVTTVDERWYIKPDNDQKTGLPTYQFVPSVTWIAEHYPKGIGYYKWLANKGWDEAEAIKEAAGDKGSKVHYAVADLINGKVVKIDSKYMNPKTEQEEELTLEEYDCIVSFTDWVKEAKPKFLQSEFVVWGEGYAGTVDLLCEIAGKIYIVDFKTSQYIWPSHELQLSAYLHALPPELDKNESFPPHLAILQLGYRLNKKKYKLTEISDKYREFEAARVIWANETEGVMPKQKDYPLEISLA